MAGHIELALTRIRRVYPNLFQENRKIQFRLMSQAFIEMIRTTYPSKESTMDMDIAPESIDAIFNFGKQLQQEYENEKDAEYADQLTNLFSIMTEADPYSSPMACLLDVSLRSALANELLTAILSKRHMLLSPPPSSHVCLTFGHSFVVHEKRSPCSAYEMLIKQLICVLSELSNLGYGQSAFIDIEKDFLTAKNSH